MTVDGVLMKVDQTCKIGIEILSEPECQASGTSAAANNGMVLMTMQSEYLMQLKVTMSL